MRFARALLASVGAGTCLVLAGTLAMATLSTVVAFSGLPGLRADGADTTPPAILAAAGPGPGTADVGREPVALALPAVRARPRTTTGAAARRAASPRTATGRVRAGAQAGIAGAPQDGPIATAPSSPAKAASGGGTGSLPEADSPAGAKGHAAPAVNAPGGGPVRDVGTAVGGVIGGIVGGVAGTVQPVSPPVAAIVNETGKAVEDATGAVVGAVDNLNRGR